MNEDEPLDNPLVHKASHDRLNNTVPKISLGLDVSQNDSQLLDLNSSA